MSDPNPNPNHTHTHALTCTHTHTHRLLVGHTHFDVDQRHSVLSRCILGRRGPADRGRTKLHSLSAFKRVIESAHKDLRFFAECTANYDFDVWLASMENKLEPGLSTHLQYQLRVQDGVVLSRSKPRMSSHVSYSPWSQFWPTQKCDWIKNVVPTIPGFDSQPGVCPPQSWKNFAKVKLHIHVMRSPCATITFTQPTHTLHMCVD